jgi:hypothetical protein
MIFCFYKAWDSGRVVWVLLSTLPFVFYGLNRASFEYSNHARSAYLAELPRHSPTGQYPNTLIIRGYLTETEIAALLWRYSFNQVLMDQDHRRSGNRKVQIFERSTGPACEAFVQKWLKNKSPSHTIQKGCVLEVGREIFDPEKPSKNAVLYLMGHATTLHEGNALWASGNFEVRLLSGGKDLLVDYWENRYISSQTSPFCIPLLTMCQKTSYSKEKFDRFYFLVNSLLKAS